MVSAAQVGLFIAALLYYLNEKSKDGTATNNDDKNNKDSDTSDNTKDLGDNNGKTI